MMLISIYLHTLEGNSSYLQFISFYLHFLIFFVDLSDDHLVRPLTLLIAIVVVVVVVARSDNGDWDN